MVRSRGSRRRGVEPPSGDQLVSSALFRIYIGLRPGDALFPFVIMAVLSFQGRAADTPSLKG